jgi:hypothetical protein
MPPPPNGTDSNMQLLNKQMVYYSFAEVLNDIGFRAHETPLCNLFGGPGKSM